MYFIGLMSGTSMDAIDAALVQFDDKATLKFYREYPLDNSIRHQIREIDEQTSLGYVSEIDNKLGHLFAEAVNDLLSETNISKEDVIAIGSHGQTVLHRPEGTHTSSLQIGDPNIIANHTGITTVADFRRMDMANGGQGAPLASAFHRYQFAQTDKTIIILNIGGMANITLLKNDEVIGFDTGPGNALLDDWIQKNKQQEYDKDGEWAKQGNVNTALLDEMMKDEYFSLAPPKSTGRDYFNLQWLESYLNKIDSNISAEDTQATLLELSTKTIATAIKKSSEQIDEVLACGGGTHNKLLMKKLCDELDGIELATTDKYGLSPDCIEAVTFAWLAKQRIENKPANLPSVTGAKKEVLLGGIYDSVKS